MHRNATGFARSGVGHEEACRSACTTIICSAEVAHITDGIAAAPKSGRGVPLNDIASCNAGTWRQTLIVYQVPTIGYFARIVPIRLSAFSAAACGVIPSRMTSASAAPQICWAFASA